MHAVTKKRTPVRKFNINKSWQIIKMYALQGVYSRAAHICEGLMYEGLLHRYGYLRLICLYKHTGDYDSAKRIAMRYTEIYKQI